LRIANASRKKSKEEENEMSGSKKVWKILLLLWIVTLVILYGVLQSPKVPNEYFMLWYLIFRGWITAGFIVGMVYGSIIFSSMGKWWILVVIAAIWSVILGFLWFMFYIEYNGVAEGNRFFVWFWTAVASSLAFLGVILTILIMKLQKNQIGV